MKRHMSLLRAFLVALGIASVVSAVAIGVTFRFIETRRMSELHAERQVTNLPSSMTQILGSRTDPSVRLPILMYHYVEYVKDKNDTIRQSLDIPPNILTAQIETLKKAGYLFVTPGYLTNAFDGKMTPADKIIMLTFDDGYRDFYTDVFPILEKEQVRAVVYIVPNFVNRPNFMYKSQLEEIARSPYVEIGAHTMDHLWLKGMSPKMALFEIAQSRKMLRDWLHVPVNSFAYPYGAFDTQTISLVRNAGFTNAVSTVPGDTQLQENRFFLYRLRPGGRTGQSLLSFLAQSTFAMW